MRNPWSHDRYNGPWNNNDRRWTREFLKQISHNPKTIDGKFYMPIREFRNTFRKVEYALYEKWRVSRKVVTPRNSTPSVNITSPRSQECIIQVNYDEKR